MKPGDYFCVSLHDLASALIRFGTRNHWNHAGIVTSKGLVEAAAKGAVLSRLDEYGRADDLISNDSEDLHPDQAATIQRKALSLLGTPYGFPDIVWLALYSTLGLKWRWLERRVMREDRMICSQLVATCYAAAGIDVVPGKRAQEVTPGDLANRIARLNGA